MKKDPRTGLPLWTPPKPDGSTRADPSAAKARAKAEKAAQESVRHQIELEEAVRQGEIREAKGRQRADLRRAIGWSDMVDELSVLRSEVARLTELVDPPQLQDPQDAPRRRRFGRP